MKTIYKVNGKRVDLSSYLYSEYHSILSELQQYSFERFLKKHPEAIEEAMKISDVNLAKDFLISRWKMSEEYAKLLEAYSDESPEKYAKQRAGCMLIFCIVVIGVCLIAILTQISGDA